jgi:hypothetical protein
MMPSHRGNGESMKLMNLIRNLPGNVKNLFALSLLIFCSDAAISQVYKYIDESGNVIYSDTPPEEQKDLAPAELPDLIIQPAVKVQSRPAVNSSASKEATEIDVNIIQPANETTITPGQMSFTVAAEITRPLARGEIAVLMVNGQEFGRSNMGLSWTVDNLVRGEMAISVRIIDRENKQLAESNTLRVFVRRPTVNR